MAGLGAKYHRKNLKKKKIPIPDLPYNIGIFTNIAHINSLPPLLVTRAFYCTHSKLQEPIFQM